MMSPQISSDSAEADHVATVARRVAVNGMEVTPGNTSTLPV